VYAAPVVARGVVYAANNSVTYSLSVLDASSGTVLWTAPTGGYADSSPAVSGGLVYLGSGDGKLYAFPAAGCGQSTCSPVWTATTGSEVQSSPSVADGMVFVGSADHNVYAFDALTGALEWTVATGDPITIQSAAVANGVVFIGSNDHVLRAIDALTGQVLWTYTTGDLIGGSSVVANGWVFAGSFDKNFYAFHLPG